MTKCVDRIHIAKYYLVSGVSHNMRIGYILSYYWQHLKCVYFNNSIHYHKIKYRYRHNYVTGAAASRPEVIFQFECSFRQRLDRISGNKSRYLVGTYNTEYYTFLIVRGTADTIILVLCYRTKWMVFVWGSDRRSTLGISKNDREII